MRSVHGFRFRRACAGEAAEAAANRRSGAPPGDTRQAWPNLAAIRRHSEVQLALDKVATLVVVVGGGGGGPLRGNKGGSDRGQPVGAGTGGTGPQDWAGGRAEKASPIRVAGTCFRRVFDLEQAAPRR